MVLGLRSVRTTDVPLLLALALAAGVRFWGIAFGLPDLDARPDETTVMNVAIGFFTGDLNPHFFNYPTLYAYCLFGLYACYYACGTLRGEFASISDLAASYASDPTSFFLLDRALSAVAGTATVYLVYRIGSRLAGRRTGLIAGFFLALAHLHVRDSHFGVTDVAAALLITCSVLSTLRATDDWGARNWLAAGALAGLATATKYAGALLLLPAALAILFYSRHRRRTGPALLFLSGLVVVFLIGCPFALLDAGRFASDLAAEAEHLQLGHRLILGRGWWYHLKYTLPIGLGRTLFLAALVGIPILMKRDWRKAAVFLAFPLAYYAVAGSGQTVFVRYMIPLVPFLCLTAAVFVSAAGGLLPAPGAVPKALAIGAVALLVILPSIRKVVLTDRLLATKDSRQLAVEWARREIPRGSSVCLAGPIWRQETPSEAVERLRSGRAAVPAAPLDPILTYKLLTYDDVSGRFKLGDAIQPGLSDYVFLRESPLLSIGGAPQRLKDLVAASYRLKASFHAINLQASHWFDMQDAVFIPLAGFAGVARPGPNIYVYQRKDSPSQ
jgi:4-amino-4-deoxy-L-arabinose transferase-like glycosyltransferase